MNTVGRIMPAQKATGEPPGTHSMRSRPAALAVRTNFGGMGTRGNLANSRSVLEAASPNLMVQAKVEAKTTSSGGTYAAGHHEVPCVGIQPHAPPDWQPTTVLRQAIGTAASTATRANRRPVTAIADY